MKFYFNVYLILEFGISHMSLVELSIAFPLNLSKQVASFVMWNHFYVPDNPCTFHLNAPIKTSVELIVYCIVATY